MPERKVLHLISTNGFYGAENVLLEICLGLQGSGRFEPIVGFLNTGNRGHLPLLRECQQHNLSCREFSCRGRYDRGLIRELKRFVRSRGITIIHSHGYKSNFYALLVRSTGIILVSTCHNWLTSDLKMRCFVWLDKILLRFFDAVVSVSRPIQKELNKWGLSRKTILIYNGVSLDTFRHNCKQRQLVRGQLGLGDSDIVFGFVGRLSREKGLEILLECGEKIHTCFPAVHIVLVGDGAMLPRLERERKEYVHPVGVQSDVESFYSAFDIFVLPSLIEGLPMVILEAMAAQLPVIASAVGSIPDVVEDGQTGYLVKPDNPASLYHAMEHLLHCPDKMHKVGKKGLEKVSQTFTSKKMVQEYIAIYNSFSG